MSETNGHTGDDFVGSYYRTMRERQRRNVYLTATLLSGLFYIGFAFFWLYGQPPPPQVEYESETITILANSLSGLYILEFLPTAIAYFCAGILRVITYFIIRRFNESGKIALVLTIITLIIVSLITGWWLLVALEVVNLFGYGRIIHEWYETDS